MANELGAVIDKFQAIVAANSDIETFVFDDLSRINEDRDKVYPVLLLNPPNSSIPNFSQFFETYSIDMYLFDSYQQEEQEDTPQEDKWEALKIIMWQVIDALRADQKNYRISPETSVNIELGHFQHSDMLIGVRVQFDLSVLNCRT